MAYYAILLIGGGLVLTGGLSLRSQRLPKWVSIGQLALGCLILLLAFG